MSVQRKELIFSVLIFATCTVLNLWLSSNGWDHNLIEGHEFRQTQTALTAREFQEEGWSFAYPLPLFGPPWSAPMEFPMYQWCVARVSALTGYSLEPTGRAVSLAFLYLTLPAIFLLLEHLGVTAPRRWLLLGLILLTPVYLYYSRSFMIESTALCVAAWFLYAYCRAVASKRFLWIVSALVLGALSALVKVTTFAVFLVPAAWFSLNQLCHCRKEGSGKRRNQLTTAAIACGIAASSVGVGFGWVHYGDRIKSSNPLSGFLVSSRLHDWNYGPLTERFQLPFWENIGRISTHSVLNLAVVIFFCCFALFIGRTYRTRILGLLVCYLAGPLAFANLYAIHDYYHYATGIFLLGAMLLAWCELLELPQGSITGKYLVIVSTLLAQLLGYLESYHRLQARADIPPPELSRVLAATTAPNDIVLIYGHEWNPLIPYNAGRKAVMVPGEYVHNIAAQDQVLSRIAPGRVTALIVTGDLRLDKEFVNRLTTKLKLEPKPLLVSDDTDFFLSERLVATAVSAIKAIRPIGFVLNAPPDAELDGVKLWRFTAAEGAKAATAGRFDPLPSEYLTPYGIAASTIDGALVLNAHAPTLVTIPVPAAATSVEGFFGISPDTYAGKHITDGVSFIVEWIADDGTKRELFRSDLTPATRLQDRGRKQFKVALPPRSSRDFIVLNTDPGPAKSNSFDWAYWSDVKVQ